MHKIGNTNDPGYCQKPSLKLMRMHFREPICFMLIPVPSNGDHFYKLLLQFGMFCTSTFDAIMDTSSIGLLMCLLNSDNNSDSDCCGTVHFTILLKQIGKLIETFLLMQS